MHTGWSSQRSLDDNDIMRIKSTSSFGWYDEFSDDSGSLLGFDDGVQLIEDWRMAERSKHSWVVNDSPEFFERRSEHITTSKTFRGTAVDAPVAYTVAIHAIRVMSTGGGHAQYEVVLTAGSSEMQCWKRFSDFKLLSEYAKISQFKDSIFAWNELQQMQRWFRCLDVNYLRRKCMLLERFLAQLLFELHTPSLLLAFVGISKKTRDDSGQSRNEHNWRNDNNDGFDFAVVSSFINHIFTSPSQRYLEIHCGAFRRGCFLLLNSTSGSGPEFRIAEHETSCSIANGGLVPYISNTLALELTCTYVGDCKVLNFDETGKTV